MGVSVREKNIEEIEDKLSEINTVLNKIAYIESALKEAGFSFEVRRFLFGKLSEFYEDRKMFEPAGRAMANKARIEVTFKEKIDEYINAAELFSRAGKLGDSEEMFIRASRGANVEQRERIKLARKNIYFVMARGLESKGKRASAVKFYEKLIKLDLDEVEKKQVKEKLLGTYKALGLFREARLIEGV